MQASNVNHIQLMSCICAALYEKIHYFAQKYTTPTRAWFGPYLVLLLVDPDDIAIVLRHENSMEKPFVYKFAKDWVGDGLITASPDLWKGHRKTIATTFNRAILENYMKIFVQQSQIMIDELTRFSGTGEMIDVFDYVSRATLDIICGK